MTDESYSGEDLGDDVRYGLTPLGLRAVAGPAPAPPDAPVTSRPLRRLRRARIRARALMRAANRSCT